MKAFSFRLDKVLNFKKYLEKKAVSDLMDVKKEYSRIQASIKRTCARQAEVAEDCSQKGKAGISVFEYRLHSSFLEKLNRDIHDRNRELENSVGKIKIHEEIVKQNSVKRNTLETLKDIHYEAYLEDVAREEQKTLMNSYS